MIRLSLSPVLEILTFSPKDRTPETPVIHVQEQAKSYLHGTLHPADGGKKSAIAACRRQSNEW